MITSTEEPRHDSSAGTSKNARHKQASSAAILRAYKQALSKDLAPEVFAANPWRLTWYFACGLGSLAGVFAIVQFNPPWAVKLLVSLFIGWCVGTLGFICHELSHGSIIQSQGWQNFLGFFGTMPLLLSPTYWRFSHNRLHHGKPQKLIEDPDAFPSLRVYRNSKFSQFMFPFTPGSGHKRSVLYFFFWFSFHNLASQFYLRFRNRVFDEMDHRRVTIELTGQIAMAMAIFAYSGPANWLWVFLVPFMVQNYVLMSYISTNHNLSPLTSENDPLENSLSVSNHWWLEFLSLNFGYHVEHHIFPKVSGKHIKAVHRELVRQFPEKYKFMPKWQAMRALYATPRIYKNAHELIHPETLQTFPTL